MLESNASKPFVHYHKNRKELCSFGYEGQSKRKTEKLTLHTLLVNKGL